MTASGLVLVDKPVGISSHAVVAAARKVFGTRQVGHGGTLDPFATGLIVLGVNDGTKLLQFITAKPKKYLAVARFGIATNTDDLTGEVISEVDASQLTDLEIHSSLVDQIGVHSQMPPQFSAKQVDGVRAYQAARQGKKVELRAKDVAIHSLTLNSVRRNTSTVDVEFEVECGSGTYIRSIARDAGAKLAVGAHLVSLRRTMTAGFAESDAVSIADLAKGFKPLNQVIDKVMPTIIVNQQQLIDISHGRLLTGLINEIPNPIGVISETGAVVAIGKPTDKSGILGYHCVFIRPLADLTHD